MKTWSPKISFTVSSSLNPPCCSGSLLLIISIIFWAFCWVESFANNTKNVGSNPRKHTSIVTPPSIVSCFGQKQQISEYNVNVPFFYVVFYDIWYFYHIFLWAYLLLADSNRSFWFHYVPLFLFCATQDPGSWNVAMHYSTHRITLWQAAETCMSGLSLPVYGLDHISCRKSFIALFHPLNQAAGRKQTNNK